MQIIHKGRKEHKWVKEDAITPLGAANKVIIIQFNFRNFIQQDIELSPNLLYNIDFDKTVCDEIKELEDELNDKVFNPYS